MPDNSTLVERAHALNRREPKATREFNEWRGVSTLVEANLLSDLRLDNLRRGREEESEPDWVFVDANGRIIAGVEVTEIANEEARQADQKLHEMKQDRLKPEMTGVNKKTAEAHMAAKSAYDIANRLGEHALAMQRIHAFVGRVWLRGEIKKRIEAKK